MGIIDKIKQNIQNKQKQAEEEARLKELHEKCDKDYSVYQQLTLAHSGNKDLLKVEDLNYTEGNQEHKEKRTIVGGEYGPVIKKDILDTRTELTGIYSSEYTIYEGFLHSEHQENLSGYYQIKYRKFIIGNPVERETNVIERYEGVHRDTSGKVTEITNIIRNRELDPDKANIGYLVCQKINNMINEKIKDQESLSEREQ